MESRIKTLKNFKIKQKTTKLPKYLALIAKNFLPQLSPQPSWTLSSTWQKRLKNREEVVPPKWHQSWNEGVTAIASRSLQAEGRFLHGCEISFLLREFRSHFAQCTGVLLKLPDSCDRHFWIFFFRYFLYKFPFFSL